MLKANLGLFLSCHIHAFLRAVILIDTMTDNQLDHWKCVILCSSINGILSIFSQDIFKEYNIYLNAVAA